jgi:cell division protein ZapA (FtsZ GTPase activity inhibitor)
MTAGDGLTYTYHLNRLANSLINGLPQLDAQGAANKWAGTTNLAIVGALNTLYASRNSGTNYNYDLQGALNALAGTTGLGINEAAARITS